MDGSGSYSNGYNDFRHIQTMSSDGAAGNTSHGHAGGTVEHPQPHQQLLYTNSRPYSNNYHSDLHQQSASTHPSYGYIQIDAGQYALSHQPPSSSAGLMEDNVNQRQQSASSGGNFDYVFPHSHRLSGSNAFNSGQRTQSVSNNSNYGYDLPQSMVAGSHARSHGQCSQIPTMNSSQYTPQGLDQFGYAKHGDYSQVVNYSSASTRGYSMNNDSNIALSSTHPASYRSHSVLNNASHRHDVPQSILTGSHVSSQGQFSQMRSSTMNRFQYAPQGPDQFGGEHSHSMNYSSAPITRHPNNNNSNPALSSTSPAMISSHVTARSLTPSHMHMSNSFGVNQMLRQKIAVQALHDLSNASTACAQSNLSQSNFSKNGPYHLSTLGQATSSFQTSSNAAMNDSKRVNHSIGRKSIESCHSSAPSAADSEGVITPGFAYVSSSIVPSATDRGKEEYYTVGNSDSLLAENNRCIVPVSAATSHCGYPRKNISPTPKTPANVKPAASKNSAIMRKLETPNSHAHTSGKSLIKQTQSAPARPKISKNKSNGRQTNTHAKASNTIPISNSTHAECPKSTTAVAGAVASRKRGVLPKSIAIPIDFSHRHSFRAAAAYSLLRTLSKELRLSPFTLQSFLSALMLPIPSRLLGEIHVRVLRVLFADIGMGCYSKHGRGDVPTFLRTKRSNASENGLAIEGESKQLIGDFVTERGCRNLFYLDNTTWPLFYEDYALATEEKFMDDATDDDAFIDIRSPVMVPSGASETQFKSRQNMYGTIIDKTSHSDRVPYPGDGWIDRCPLGPFGHRNDEGRFTCCPFHIHVALNIARQGRPVPSKTAAGSVPVSSAAKKRKRPTSTTKHRMKKDSVDVSLSESDYSESSPEFDEFKSRKKPTGTGRRGRPRKFPKPEPRSTTSSIKGTRVIDVQIAPSYVTKPDHINTSTKSTVVRPQKASTSDLVSLSASVPKLVLSQAKGNHKIVPNQKMSALTSKSPLATSPRSCEGALAPRPTDSHGSSFPPVFVAPIPPQPVDVNSLVVPVSVKNTLARFFSEGDIFLNDSDENGNGISSRQNSSHHEIDQLNNGGIVDEPQESNIDADNVEIWDLVNQLSQSPPNSKEELSHMIPIRLLRKGIPYHHLSLESKLTIIEFLVDELLTVDEISKELTLRHQLTGPYDFLFGPVPQQCEFEDINNQDECSICGLEGDLLCCDGCPGSFHRQCLGMAPSGKLPQGKWLCTECRVPDASKMGPLGSENRPLIGWFTLDELEARPQPIRPLDGTGCILAPSPPGISHSVASSQQNEINRNCSSNSQPQDMCTLFSVTPQTAVADNTNSDLSMKIPLDVEFLVSSGKVFARYRSSRRKFNPLGPCAIESSALSLTQVSSHETSFRSQDEDSPQRRNPVQLLFSQNPPEPLSNVEVIELIRLLGPEMCLKLPWRGLVFDPHKMFATGDYNRTPTSSPSISNCLDSLISYQNEKRELLANHPDTANPLDYDNKYRRAPPIPKLKHQLGQFIFPTVVPEMVTFPTKIGAQLLLSLSNATSLGICPKVSMPFPDVIQSIRDTLVKTGRLLYDGCLLDYRWGTLDQWRARVQNANSFSQLSVLLVKLADACCPRAFHRQWYEVKESGNVDETTRLASNGHGIVFSSIIEGWSPEREKRRRRWERCTTATVFHLLNDERISIDTDIFKKREATTKRGKKNKLSCTVVHCANNSNSESGAQVGENRQLESDQQSRIEVMGAARVCFTSTPVSSNPKNEIGPYKNYNVSRARSSRAGDLAASVPNPHPRYEPIPSEGVEKISEYLPTSVPAVNIEREPSSSPTTQACEKSKPIVDVSLERPISEGSDPNSPLRVNSGFSESGNMSGQLKLKVAKKRRKTRESSIPPSAKKRRSDCHSVIRLQMRSLLGLDTADSSHKIDREIAEIKLDMLEKLLAETDDSFFFSIAGRKVSWFRSHTSPYFLTSYRQLLDFTTCASYSNRMVAYRRPLSSDSPGMLVLCGRLSSHTKHCLKLGNVPLVTNGESQL
eukprot:CCRYP_011960-RB/>CCRYP_011960-RB protein AED:0.00 eAED:0.00 QI:653/1/1/1/1/0.66/3/1621/2004